MSKSSAARHSILWLLSLTSLLPRAVPAADWPQWLGPDRNGTYSGNDLAESWPKDGPPVVWQIKVGEGFSGPVVAGTNLILHHRVKDEDLVQCLDPANGRERWVHRHPTRYRDSFGFDEGPRSTPLVDRGQVYTYSAEGLLLCLSAADGSKRWAIDTGARFDTSQGFFGRACSPMVEGDALMLILGGANGAGLVAFHRETGATLWKATDQEASYSSPVLTEINGQSRAVFFTREGGVMLDPGTGAVQWTFPWRPGISASVNAASPLARGAEVFLSTSYGRGAVLLRADGSEPRVIWSSDESLSSHYATPVVYDGHLYGFHGRQEQGCALRCVAWATGKVMWSHDGLGAGTVTLAGGRLLVLTESGRLIRAPATSAGWTPEGEVQVLGFHTRAHPALAGGRLFARDKSRLVCVDLR